MGDSKIGVNGRIQFKGKVPHSQRELSSSLHPLVMKQAPPTGMPVNTETALKLLMLLLRYRAMLLIWMMLVMSDVSDVNDTCKLVRKETQSCSVSVRRMMLG